MRYRLRWSKQGKLRFLSHHDIATVFERSVRRARLPLAYTQGFSAHPKIAFGSGLPVGYGSNVELLDIELTDDLDPDELRDRMNGGLPQGIRVERAERLLTKGVSLGELIVAADYEIDCDAPWLDEALERFVALDTYEFSRPYKGAMRVDDLRAGVVLAEPTTTGLRLRVRIKPRSTRPGDVMTALTKLAQVDELPVMSVRRTDLLGASGDGYFSLLGLPHELAEVRS
jgi:radical SAM-linked protein